MHTSFHHGNISQFTTYPHLNIFLLQMIFAASDYITAEEFVKTDPLVSNECVDWHLNQWIPETGDITVE